MNVAIPFTYRINFKEPRRAQWSNAAVLEIARIDITEYDPEAAPIAHVVRDASRTERVATVGLGRASALSVSKFHVPGGDCAVRLVDGRYYASRFPVDEIERWRGDDEFDPFAAVTTADGKSEFRHTLTTKLSPSAMSIAEFNEFNPNARKVQSERDIDEAAIRQLAERFIVVGGVLHEEVDEPTLSVVTTNEPLKAVEIFIEEARLPLLDRFLKGGRRGEKHQRTRFGIDEFDRAMAFAERRAAEIGTTVKSHAEVVSTTPDVVRFRGEHEHLMSAARQALNALTPMARVLPADAGLAVMEAANLFSLHNRLTPRAIAALRNLVGIFGSDGAENALEPQEVALVSDYWLQDSYYRIRSGKDEILLAAKGLEDALKRWDERPDDGFEWLELGLDAIPAYAHPRRAFEITNRADAEAIATRWKGDLAAAISGFDPETQALVVVEDFERHRPQTVAVFMRDAPDRFPSVFHNGDCPTADQDVELAIEFASSDRKFAMRRLAGAASSRFTA